MTGTIPPYAAGTLYRTGPGAYQVEGTPVGTVSLSHWFDGFSQTHRFQIIPSLSASQSMRVMYNSRLHVDGQIESIRQTGTMKYFTFAQKYDPCSSLFKKVMSDFKPSKDDVNIGVTLSTNLPGLKPASSSRSSTHSSGINSLWAKSDASMLKELDPETLEPVGLAQQADLDPSLTGPLSAAHAKSDPITGDVFNYNLSIHQGCVYRVFKTCAASSKTEILATISGRAIRPAYLHSLFLTKNFVILCIWNSHLARGGAAMLETNNILDAIAPWDASQKATWLVVDRHLGRGVVAAFQSPPYFCFHSVNSYEEPGKSNGYVDILCDVMQYENLDILHEFYYENLLGKSNPENAAQRPRARYTRYRLPGVPISQSSPTAVRECLETGVFPQAKLEGQFPQSASGDLPIINPRFATQAHRYVYCVADRGMSSFLDGLLKLDTSTHKTTFWQNPWGHTPGEAIFVANPNGIEEDDGVLLSVVLDGFKRESYLLCLDAKTMQELGRAECNWAVHFGYHGQHVRAADPVRAVDV